MKSFRAPLLAGSLAALVGLAGCATTREQVDPDAPAPRVIVERYPQAYEVLTPHGEWIYVGGYGHVWRPYTHVVGPDFYPYATGGRWVYSNAGWMFATDWSWGHVPFHYGRWFYASGYGWVWLPGSVWAPSWVYWRYGGGYVGWAPMPPRGHYLGSYASWCFVDRHDFGHRYVGRYRIDPRKARRAYHEATPVGSGRRGGPSPKWFADASAPPALVDGKGRITHPRGNPAWAPDSKDARPGATAPRSKEAAPRDWNGGAREATPPAPRDWKGASEDRGSDWGGPDWGGSDSSDSSKESSNPKGSRYDRRTDSGAGRERGGNARPWETGEKGWRRSDARAATPLVADDGVMRRSELAPEARRYRGAPRPAAPAYREPRAAPVKQAVKSARAESGRSRSSPRTSKAAK